MNDPENNNVPEDQLESQVTPAQEVTENPVPAELPESPPAVGEETPVPETEETPEPALSTESDAESQVEATEPSDSADDTVSEVVDEPVAEEPAADAAAESVSEPETVTEPAAEEPQEKPAPTPAKPGKKWYAVKVASAREDSIKKALERRIKLDNLEEYVGRIVIPVEKVTEVRDGKKKIKKHKKFPGYIFCEVEYNEYVMYLFRETNGVGDFVGAGLNKPPIPMSDREVTRMLSDQEEFLKEDADKVGAEERGGTKIKLAYAIGDQVKVRDGMFASMTGEVRDIIDPDTTPKVKLVLSIWGRPVDVELEYWQVDPA
ncbi:MAG: transcription termination/antitermination NusG family protein [Zavarzinella sp.]